MRPRTGRDAHRVDVRFVAKTNVKEVMDIPPTEIIRILESDFGDNPKGEHLMSQDDMLFLEKVGNGIHQETDGHCSMPLPFRVRPSLPNNRDVVLCQYNHLKRRFKQNEGYLHDYQKFMDEILERRDAEKIPTEELEDETAWYVPHHGIYHSNKPGKIRVVFDCSAKYQGIALNDHLLQGPDLTNGLIGVLARFRKEPIAIMYDIEKIFRQFRVDKRDRNYLRFLWNDEDYRMKVHLFGFGATSSPGCANYAFKQVAKDYEGNNHRAAYFMRRNFYVDDGLMSVESVDHATKLIEETRLMCAKGNLRLHTFISNSREVMETIPY